MGWLRGLLALVMTAAAGSALASPYIDFNQFGPSGVYVPEGVSGVTWHEGRSFSLTGPGLGFVRIDTDVLNIEHRPALWDLGAPGPVTLTFGSSYQPTRPFDIAVAPFPGPQSAGPYQVTFNFYSGSGLVEQRVLDIDWAQYAWTGRNDWSLVALQPFTSVVIQATGDSQGLIFAGWVPEPQAWTMMVAGIALTGGMLRAGRRRPMSV